MPTIPHIDFEFKRIKIIPDSHPETKENIYTIIVGKNGVGKSKILSQIAKEYTYTYQLMHWEVIDARLSSEREPKLIAASTSPFDKFPSLSKKSENSDTNYRYIGMRNDGIYNTSSSIALLSSAAKGLLSSAIRQQGNPQLLNVFSALGFFPTIEMVFKPSYIRMTRRGFDFEPHVQELPNDLLELKNRYGISLEDKYLGILEDMPHPLRNKVIDAIYQLNKIIDRKKAIALSLDLATGYYKFIESSDHISNRTIEALLLLLGAGFLRLMDLIVTKKEYGEMSLKRASSGEQCLTVLMLGIAGHITDGSTILIDEPEISLHPKWQEMFMPLLIEAFSSFSGCQFIIATHSPQIISRLGANNCYILSLTKNLIYPSSEFYNKSADFQLAELFDAPGLMNEYISRLAFNLLAKVKSAKTLSNENKEALEKLIELSVSLDKNDPTAELIDSVISMCNHYAKN